MNSAPGPPGLWQEARNSDGRVYYYNTVSKQTQWIKPPELMTPAERALADQPWKEYTAEGGRKYWYNTETKQSSWEMPAAYKNALAQTGLPPKPVPAAPQFVAGGFGAFTQREDVGDRGPGDRPTGFSQNETNGLRGPTFQKSSDPEYNTYEEAEAAFIKLLKRANVQPDWTWMQAMKATIKDPQYRAVKDPKDREAAFEKYVTEVRLQEKDRAKERLAKLRADFAAMLRSHPEIKHYTRWSTARPILEHEAIFRSTDDDNERRQLFEEYIIDLKKTNVEREAVTRKSAMEDLVGILKALDLEPYTRWSEASLQIQANGRFVTDEKFKILTKSDILTAFENHIKSLERKFNDERQREKSSKARKERKNRDAFIHLLRELKADGKIKAGTRWMDIHPLIESASEYHNLLGQAGSTPLDLFWDIVEEEERALRMVRNEVYDVLEDRRYEVTPKTTFSEFQNVMQSDRRTSPIPIETLNLLFTRLLEKVNRRNEEDKHAMERHSRRAVDALRSRIKHLDPPLKSSSTWDSVRTQISHLEEYKAIKSDDLRRQAFDKVMRRIKEKEEDVEREREARSRHERDRDRDRERERDRDRDRERERNSNNSNTERRSKRTSRTPEPDAYEADRRKAMADRERQYRKGGGATAAGLSPTPRDKRSLDRDRHDRKHADGRLAGYDRERERDRDREYSRRDRDWDEDRERSSYRPRGSVDELDYGGSGGGGGSGSARRRRGESEGAESIGSRKKAKRDRSREEKKAKKEEIAMHSGSEEGEMVEEE